MSESDKILQFLDSSELNTQIIGCQIALNMGYKPLEIAYLVLNSGKGWESTMIPSYGFNKWFMGRRILIRYDSISKKILFRFHGFKREDNGTDADFIREFVVNKFNEIFSTLLKKHL